MSELPAKAASPNLESQPFWDATGEGRIDLPRCTSCGLVVFYPRGVCPDCQSTDLVWETMAGTGEVYSFSITRSGGSRRWREHLPYVVAYVKLDEGPTMLTNVVGCDPETVEIGMRVKAVFDDTGEGHALVRFEPA